jgi:hypothetical protein
MLDVLGQILAVTQDWVQKDPTEQLRLRARRSQRVQIVVDYAERRDENEGKQI